MDAGRKGRTMFLYEGIEKAEIYWNEKLDWETIDQKTLSEYSIPLIPPNDETPNIPERVNPVMPPF